MKRLLLLIAIVTMTIGTYSQSLIYVSDTICVKRDSIVKCVKSSSVLVVDTCNNGRCDFYIMVKHKNSMETAILSVTDIVEDDGSVEIVLSNGGIVSIVTYSKDIIYTETRSDKKGTYDIIIEFRP